MDKTETKEMEGEFEGHTRGPWLPDEEEYSQYVHGPDGELICEMRGWGYLTGNRRNLSEKDAMKIQNSNCRLIAKVPDLLKENQSLRSELQKAKELNGELVKFIKDNLWANEHDWNRINELIKKSNP